MVSDSLVNVRIHVADWRGNDERRGMIFQCWKSELVSIQYCLDPPLISLHRKWVRKFIKHVQTYSIYKAKAEFLQAWKSVFSRPPLFYKSLLFAKILNQSTRYLATDFCPVVWFGFFLNLFSLFLSLNNGFLTDASLGLLRTWLSETGFYSPDTSSFVLPLSSVLNGFKDSAHHAGLYHIFG